jgi:hypothetical protein
MARHYVTHEGPYDHPPFSRSGCYRVWSDDMPEPIREIHWFESHGVPLVDAGGTRSEVQAREEAYSVVRSFNNAIETADAYRRRK